jgi:hypothetical protein
LEITGAVLSVTIFLVASIAEICREIVGPTRMLEYADHWVILTRQNTKNSGGKTTEGDKLGVEMGKRKLILKNKSHAD